MSTVHTCKAARESSWMWELELCTLQASQDFTTCQMRMLSTPSSSMTLTIFTNQSSQIDQIPAEMKALYHTHVCMRTPQKMYYWRGLIDSNISPWYYCNIYPYNTADYLYTAYKLRTIGILQVLKVPVYQGRANKTYLASYICTCTCTYINTHSRN